MLHLVICKLFLEKYTIRIFSIAQLLQLEHSQNFVSTPTVNCTMCGHCIIGKNCVVMSFLICTHNEIWLR